MTQRIDYRTVAPQGVAAMREIERYVRGCGLSTSLLELVRVRTSQINGCAYCLDMHSKDARAAGETEQRLHVLSAWWEAPFYTDQERAALEWTEAITRIADGHVPETIYRSVRQAFSDKELADLTIAIVAINGWNRLAIAFGSPVGGYEPSPKAVRP